MTEEPKSTQKRKASLGSLAERCAKAEAEVERLSTERNKWYVACREAEDERDRLKVRKQALIAKLNAAIAAEGETP